MVPRLMLSDREKGIIVWRLHLRSSPQVVYSMLSTDEGRVGFWASKSVEKNGVVELVFPDGSKLRSRIIENRASSLFVIEYFGGSTATFELENDGRGGTDLTLRARNVKYYDEELPGWISVLLALKAATDFSVDLRNHDTERTWSKGYCDN